MNGDAVGHAGEGGVGIGGVGGLKVRGCGLGARHNVGMEEAEDEKHEDDEEEEGEVVLGLEAEGANPMSRGTRKGGGATPDVP